MQIRLMRLMRWARKTQLSLAWLKTGGWLGAHLTGSVPQALRKRHIEAMAEATERLGPQRLADESGEPGGKRTPAVVRILVPRRRPVRLARLRAAACHRRRVRRGLWREWYVFHGRS